MRVKLLIVVAAALLVALPISAGYYKCYCQMHWKSVEVLAGPYAAQVGKVTSHVPFDLWVEVNVPASEAEKRWTRENAPWQDAEHLRAWANVWRWQVQPIDPTGGLAAQ